jgi:hypothetical protein
VPVQRPDDRIGGERARLAAVGRRQPDHAGAVGARCGVARPPGGGAFVSSNAPAANTQSATRAVRAASTQARSRAVSGTADPVVTSSMAGTSPSVAAMRPGTGAGSRLGATPEPGAPAARMKSAAAVAESVSGSRRQEPPGSGTATVNRSPGAKFWRSALPRSRSRYRASGTTPGASSAPVSTTTTTRVCRPDVTSGVAWACVAIAWPVCATVTRVGSAESAPPRSMRCRTSRRGPTASAGPASTSVGVVGPW